MAKARGMHDAAERLRLCREAEVILAQEAPILPLTYNNWYLLLKPRGIDKHMRTVRLREPINRQLHRRTPRDDGRGRGWRF